MSTIITTVLLIVLQILLITVIIVVVVVYVYTLCYAYYYYHYYLFEEGRGAAPCRITFKARRSDFDDLDLDEDDFFGGPTVLYYAII